MKGRRHEERQRVVGARGRRRVEARGRQRVGARKAKGRSSKGERTIGDSCILQIGDGGHFFGLGKLFFFF